MTSQPVAPARYDRGRGLKSTSTIVGPYGTGVRMSFTPASRRDAARVGVGFNPRPRRGPLFGGRRTERLSILVILSLLLLSAACSMVQPSLTPLGTEQNPVKLSLAPTTDTRKALAAGEPLVKLLEKETGLRVKLSVPTSYAATIEAMSTHNIDVGWLAPLAYVLAHDRVGAEVLVANVRNGSTTSMGQIVVRADSGITDLDALRGKRFAFADDVSVTGHHLPVAFLLARGLNPADHFADTVFVGGDDRVLMAVYNRQVDAGAIVGESGPDAIAMSTLARTSFQPLPPDLGEQLRIIARTDSIPNDVVSVRKGVPPEPGQKIRDGLLRVAASPDGAAALRELYGIDSLGPGADADFASLRAAARLLALDLDAELAPRQRSAAP
jgi:phosphonate transport system substrate-binding protein